MILQVIEDLLEMWPKRLGEKYTNKQQSLAAFLLQLRHFWCPSSTSFWLNLRPLLQFIYIRWLVKQPQSIIMRIMVKDYCCTAHVVFHLTSELFTHTEFRLKDGSQSMFTPLKFKLKWSHFQETLKLINSWKIQHCYIL